MSRQVRRGVAPLVDRAIDHGLQPQDLISIIQHNSVDPRAQAQLRHAAHSAVLVEDHRLVDENLEERVIIGSVDLGDETLTETGD